MKTRIPLVSLCLAASLLATGGKAHAQTLNFPIINVNEAGMGTLDLGPPEGPPIILLRGTVAADPGPGGLSALTYNLSLPQFVPSLVAGDVVLLEPVGTAVISDIIRFNPAGTGSPNYPASLVFYSDNLDGSDSLADTRFPLLNYANSLTLTEVGPEVGPNGFMSYTPTANQPGFVPGFAVTYNFTSDSAVPEPSSLVVLSLGLAGVAALTWRQRKAKVAA
jgi:hypothetical protein